MSFLKKHQSNKHAKLGEGWSEHRDPYRDGVSFVAKFLGSHLVEELRHGQTYAQGRSSETIRTIKSLRSKSGKPPTTPKVELLVKSTGITVSDLVTKHVLIEAPIERISFCTADGEYPKVFAFMARNSINETTECFAFSCSSPRVAFEISQGVNQAFQLARDEKFERLRMEKLRNSEMKTKAQPTTTVTSSVSNNQSENRNIPDWVSFED